ncbi:aminoglycoside phosphotransferase family protein [Frankia sp. AgPm24]|uniref:aminoglycoside phosphotransferase family protein n=1 Tax=Frankia sp. AgPm24 TaxID=631128 RepID=UPI0020103E6C|nr:aminoglycoside phosphotransferase family protein [Frankia sp. AgPm24]MCK9921778.1 aminoglycoside phosphotransferase family protein [Frankia sp. AgPm24]
MDREPVLAAFWDELALAGEGPRVLNVTGVGGIGKSRLTRELRDSAAAHYRTASLDLQVHASRQQEDALAMMRNELGAQGVSFDRFDIAYAVLWQRLHPHLRLRRSELAFVDESSILTDIVDGMAGIPVFGTARGLVRLLDRGGSDLVRRRRVRRDPTLATLDDLPNSELADAVTYLFAEDLRAASVSRQYVILVDTHEALVPNPLRAGRAQLADAWLRDLVAQLDRGLVVIAGREPLHWERTDPEWDGLIRVCALDGLPWQARLDLLEGGGVTDSAQRHAVAEASAGLPFYLNLAVDTHLQSNGQISGVLVSPEEILARFLQHVASEEIRSLEVLSPTRLFDYDVFRALATAFHLPEHRIAWESLTAYSFVYPADAHAAGPALRFHQLMAAALRERLSPESTAEIHAKLRVLWEDRATRATGQDSGARSARALREAIYHALRCGQADATSVLDFADRAVRCGGHSAARGISDDLRTLLESQPAHADLHRALRCLDAEAAVRLGDAAEVAALAPAPEHAQEPGLGIDLGTPAGARLAVAVGNGRRIGGETTAALTIFTHVWDHAIGPPQLAAGLWAADLHMAQGRFRDAETLTVALDDAGATAASRSRPTSVEQAEFRADVARLRHLAHRFAFDFTAAARHLEEAAAWYAQAGSVLGSANIQTNRAELLALTHPAQAIVEAGRAIEIQREIGARHELGKAYTALAVGQLRCGQLDEAEGSLHAARDTLEAVGYRSGRARAEFYQAVLHARQGRMDEAIDALCWTVEELEAADVYPTIILCAAQVLDALGIYQEAISAAAGRARTRIQPYGTVADLESRIERFVGELLDGQVWRPEDLHRRAVGRLDGAAGFYNRNVRLDTPSGDVVVRIPIAGSDMMDLMIWPEADILRAIRGTVTHAPRLLYASTQPRYQIADFLVGDLLDHTAPRDTRVPAHVLADVADLVSQLGSITIDRIPPLPPGWPEDGRTTDFARRLSAVTAGVHARFRPEFGALYVAFGIPDDALHEIENRWDTLHSRPFRLLHTDLHRKNIIVADGQAFFLDWELALWGDPVYELAVHLHKMAYQPDEAETVTAQWARAVTGPAAAGWQADLATYLAHERIKSAIVDTVRYTKILTDGNLTAEAADALLDKLVGKLTAAHTILGTSLSIDRAGADTLIRQWAAGRRR